MSGTGWGFEEEAVEVGGLSWQTRLAFKSGVMQLLYSIYLHTVHCQNVCHYRLSIQMLYSSVDKSQCTVVVFTARKLVKSVS